MKKRPGLLGIPILSILATLALPGLFIWFITWEVAARLSLGKSYGEAFSITLQHLWVPLTVNGGLLLVSAMSLFGMLRARRWARLSTFLLNAIVLLALAPLLERFSSRLYWTSPFSVTRGDVTLVAMFGVHLWSALVLLISATVSGYFRPEPEIPDPIPPPPPEFA